jgi:hypothetical protein
MSNDKTPTYMDHHYLNFWLWACLRDGEAYLAASAALTAELRKVALGKGRPDLRTFNQRRIQARSASLALLKS